LSGSNLTCKEGDYYENRKVWISGSGIISRLATLLLLGLGAVVLRKKRSI
jgi:hypothetical protein